MRQMGRKQLSPDRPMTVESALPSAFEQALHATRRDGSFCAVSRVAVDHLGAVCAVEWGVIDNCLLDWHAGPVTADVESVLQALAGGAEVFAVFPTGTGFACGGKLIVSATGRRLEFDAFGTGWCIDNIARLSLSPHRLNATGKPEGSGSGDLSASQDAEPASKAVRSFAGESR